MRFRFPFLMQNFHALSLSEYQKHGLKVRVCERIHCARLIRCYAQMKEKGDIVLQTHGH